MKSLRYIISLLILVVVSCTTPLTDDQKISDSVLLKQTHEYTLNEDGSVDYHYYHRRLYNTYMSFHRLYGETFVVYNPDYQTLSVSKSQTTMADGKKVNSPENAFNEVLPFQAADAPAYNHLREMVITHVGLEIGAIVELDYTIHTKAGFVPVFAANLMLNESSPIKKLEVIVKVPSSQKLNHTLLNQTYDMVFEKGAKGKYDTYKWTSINVKARSNEPNQVEGMVDYQTLLFSNTDLAGTLEFLKTNITKDFSAHQSMENLLISKSKGWDLVEELRAHVANNMNIYRVMPQHAGFRFRSPEMVWASNGGTESEKAILLASILKHVGVNAEVTLAAYPQYLNKEVGCPSVFDRYLVKVEIDGEIRYIKPIDDKTAIPGARQMVSLTEDIGNLNIAPVEKQNLKLGMSAQIQIDKNGEVTGNATLRFSEFDKEKGFLSGVPSSSFTSKEMPKEDSLWVYSLEISKGVNVEKTGDYLSFSLPSLSQGIASAKLAELPGKRETRLELPASFNERYEFVVKLPKGFKPVSPAYSEILENGFGKVEIRYEISDDAIKVTRNLVINKAAVPKESYSDFRQLITLWMDGNMNRVLAKKE